MSGLLLRHGCSGYLHCSTARRAPWPLAEPPDPDAKKLRRAHREVRTRYSVFRACLVYSVTTYLPARKPRQCVRSLITASVGRAANRSFRRRGGQAVAAGTRANTLPIPISLPWTMSPMPMAPPMSLDMHDATCSK